MSPDTISQHGGSRAGSLPVEFANGYDATWGLVLHSESIQIDRSKVDSEYRTRGFTHTLNISGVHLRTYLTSSDDDPQRLLDVKDKLTTFFYSNDAVAIDSSMTALFPSIVNEDNIVWEPVSLNIAEGTYTDELKYTATLVYKRNPKDDDIKSISVFGKDFWDGSDVSFKRQYDRITKRITQITTINGTINCPVNMSWTKAIYFFDQANSLQLTSGTSNKDITDAEVTKNFDKQTVSYSVSGYSILDKGDSDAFKMNIFGHDWPGVSEVSIDTNSVYDTHLSGIDAALQTVGFSLSISCPDDMEFSDAMQHYQYAMSMIPKKFYPTFGNNIYRYGINNAWEIESINPTFNLTKKTVNISIKGSRIIRRKPISKSLKFTNTGQGFLWTGSSIEYGISSEIQNFIFSESISTSGNAKIPNDMSEIEALIIESEIKKLRIFDNEKYPGYKLTKKAANYNKFERTLTYSIELKKIDFYDPIYIAGSTIRYRSANDPDRKVNFSYGVLSSIKNVQFDVEYKEDYSRNEDDSTLFGFSVTGRLKTILDETTGKQVGESVESILDKIWKEYVDTDKILNKKYICNQSSRSISVSAMEGTFSLSFTDFGRESQNIGFYFPENMGSSGLLITGQFDEDSSIMQFGSSSDSFSDGLLYQENGKSVRTISLSGSVNRKEFKNKSYITKWKRILENVDRNGGFLTLRGASGRVRRLSMSAIDISKKSAKISATIEVQPNINYTKDPVLVKF